MGVGLAREEPQFDQWVCDRLARWPTGRILQLERWLSDQDADEFVPAVREALRQLRRYQELRELDRPIVILIGGATGTGKSTVATEIAYRLGITRVTSTDFIRQTMRAFFSLNSVPETQVLSVRKVSRFV